MTHIDKTSQDTVQIWENYNPNDIKPSVLVPTEMSPLYQLIEAGNNIKFEDAYQFMFNCTGLFTQFKSEDLFVSPNYSIPTSSNMPPVDVLGAQGSLEKYKKLLKEILFSIRLQSTENDNH